MSERETGDIDAHVEPEEPLKAPGPGSPAGETLGEGSEAGQLENTPTMSGEEQAEGQTQHPAPPDDVGVPEDVPRD